MTVILADVGGTNTRMARSTDGALDSASVRWFRNDDYPDFAAVLSAFGTARAHALCIAVAGPVWGRTARLTNRDWAFDADAMPLPATLMNDLQAVGHALSLLPSAAVQTITSGTAEPGAQRLVVGLGTGFNVSLVAGDAVLRAEFGHATLPGAVTNWLDKVIPGATFPSVEALFSGKGAQRLHAVRTGQDLGTNDIIARAPGSVQMFAQALGVLATQLVYQYLPLGGIVLNGGLARAVMTTPAGQAGFATGFAMDKTPGAQFGQIPVDLVTDDTAALYGCARVSACA